MNLTQIIKTLDEVVMKQVFDKDEYIIAVSRAQSILKKIDEGKMGKEINVFLCKRHGIKYEGVLARDIAKSLTNYLGGRDE